MTSDFSAILLTRASKLFLSMEYYSLTEALNNTLRNGIVHEALKEWRFHVMYIAKKNFRGIRKQCSSNAFHCARLLDGSGFARYVAKLPSADVRSCSAPYGFESTVFQLHMSQLNHSSRLISATNSKHVCDPFLPI